MPNRRQAIIWINDVLVMCHLTLMSWTYNFQIYFSGWYLNFSRLLSTLSSSLVANYKNPHKTQFQYLTTRAGRAYFKMLIYAGLSILIKWNWLNSLWLIETIWRYRSGSTSGNLGPSHYHGPMFTNYQWGLVAFHWVISQDMLKISILEMSLKISHFRLQQHLPAGN